MKTNALLLTLLSLTALAGLAVAAGDEESRQLKADAIYNEIMMTLTPEMKAKIDSSKASVSAVVKERSGTDSGKSVKELQEKAAVEKTRRLEALPDELRQQVEKAMQEMEKRQTERALEFKEMKRERR
ncbi:MAG: hypothetical protein JXA71_11865 [Chitinispirillaceae bacterium]|nr:hypothetical protein [Chitinispirillaceae bacterium]